MVRRLAQTEVDDKGRSQIPIAAKQVLDLKKKDALAWWLADEQIIVSKLGTGTPQPPKFREFVP